MPVNLDGLFYGSDGVSSYKISQTVSSSFLTTLESVLAGKVKVCCRMKIATHVSHLKYAVIHSLDVRKWLELYAALS